MGAARGSLAARGVAPGRLRGASHDGDAAARGRVSEMQRLRLLAAAVASVEERGYPDTTVAHIAGRAGVSRRTFYALFDSREDCLLAVLQDALGRVTAELVGMDLAGMPWRERLRTGLSTILDFFESEPALARVCVVQSARGSVQVLERREEILRRMAGAVDEGRGEGPRAAQCAPLTAEGLVGAVVAILHSRLLAGQREPLGDLLGELMGMIVLPYLGSAAARRERTRPLPQRSVRKHTQALAGITEDPLLGIPMRLTYRTARVLEDLAAHPGVSNREVAARVGITDQGQVSKLLGRLERLGLLQNTGEGQSKGEPNAWWLTPTGERLTQSIQSNGRYTPQPA
jgi:AcrR family transcriptional regulator